MKKSIKTCIYVITSILPIVLSACSNKTNDNNTSKSVKESTTTLLEDTSTYIKSSSVETTTTEEDTTELISETEQEPLNSIDITSQQQTQTTVQQMTTVTSVNSTPVPIQNNEQPVVQTTPIPTTPIPTTPIPTTPIPTTPTPTPIPNTPMPTPTIILKDIKGIGEKYSYKGKEFRIDEVAYTDGFNLSFSINISVTDTFTISQLPFEMYCRYDIYNTNGTCVKTGYFNFICDIFHTPDETTNPSSSNIYLTDYCNSAFDIDDLSCGEYSIVFSDYE